MSARALRWLAAGAIVGFAAPAVFSWALRWERVPFVAGYLALAGPFLGFFFHRHDVGRRHFLHRWRVGLVAGSVLGAFLAWSVLRQPPSPVPQGWGLLAAVAWLGVVYGALDSLLLTVMPVMAVGGAKLRGLAASIALTAAYHAGFVEYQGPGLAAAIFGNTLMTLAYVLTGSPLAAILAHVAMHVAAVLHGADSTLQLPPHYGP